MASATQTSELKSRSALLYGPHDVRIEDRPVPELGDDDVLVQISFVGVCGSDVHFWKHGGIGAKVSTERPLTMGHEASGKIHSVGPKITHLQPGQRVAIEPGLPCRTCKACKSGTYNLCPRMAFAAAPPDVHGTLTQYYRVKADFVYALPEHVSLEEGVLVEPLSVAVHAVKLGDVRPGETVVVMGSGTIGLLSAAVARVFGAERIVLVDVLERKLEFARGYLGGCETFLADGGRAPEENAKRVLEMLGEGGGVDTVLECSGAGPSIAAGIEVLKGGGKYVQIGLGQRKVEFPISLMSEKELMVRGCFRYGSGDYELAISLLRRRVVDVKSLISSVVDFGDVAEAWNRTARGEGIKNMIRVSGS